MPADPRSGAFPGWSPSLTGRCSVCRVSVCPVPPGYEPSQRRSMATALLALVLVAAACGVRPPGPEAGAGPVAVPPPSPTPPSSATRSTPRSFSLSVKSSPGGCTVTARGTGTGSFACAKGPSVTISLITDDAVSFRLKAEGDETTITSGSQGTLGPYLITVRSIDDGTATIDVRLT